MARGSAAAQTPLSGGATPAEFEARSLTYGDLVGQLVSEFDPRTAQTVATPTVEAPHDVFHTVSVACGYVGLLAGFAVAAGGIFLLL